jgi:hypothetical protein
MVLPRKSDLEQSFLSIAIEVLYCGSIVAFMANSLFQMPGYLSHPLCVFNLIIFLLDLGIYWIILSVFLLVGVVLAAGLKVGFIEREHYLRKYFSYKISSRLLLKLFCFWSFTVVVTIVFFTVAEYVASHRDFKELIQSTTISVIAFVVLFYAGFRIWKYLLCCNYKRK